MKITKKVNLEVTKCGTSYLIHINGGKHFDTFRLNNNNYRIDCRTQHFLNDLLCLNLSTDELQNYLVDNYLIKDIEDMSNLAFADYLVNHVKGLYRFSDYIQYKENSLYDIRSGDINFQHWHGKILKGKVDFCKFDGRNRVKSNGYRKQFVNIVKQVIEHIEKFEIKLEDGEDNEN